MQAINEQSLKLLNEYIERLHTRQDVHPVSLIFYMRNNSSSFARSLQTLQHSSSEGKSLAFNCNIKTHSNIKTHRRGATAVHSICNLSHPSSSSSSLLLKLLHHKYCTCPSLPLFKKPSLFP